MDLTALPNCCGAGFLSSLYLSPTEISFRTIKDKLIQAKKEGLYLYHASYRGVNHGLYSTSFGAVFAITSDSQSPHDAPVLTKIGFTSILTFENPIHKSMLTLWMFDLNKVTVEDLETIQQ